MKRNTSAILVGALLILVGLGIVGRSFGLFHFSFDGWWTAFIIVPCLVGLINGDGGSRIGSLIGLGFGILLLCCARGWVKWSMFAPTLLAVALVAVGLGLIIGDNGRRRIKQNLNPNQGSNQQCGNACNNGDPYANGPYNANNGAQNTANQTTYTYNPQTNTYDTSDVHFTSDGGNAGTAAGSGAQGGNGAGCGTQGGNGGSGNGNFNRGSMHNNEYGRCVCTAALCGREIRYDGEVFNGGMISAVLGGIELDLRTAVITGTVVLEARCVLGGIDIYAPRYARVIVNGSPILGGIENATRFPQGANEQTPTIIVNASCVLGGLEVK